MRRIVATLLAIILGVSGFPFDVFAVNTQIRQEVNITDAYFYAASGVYATSSEMVAITDNNYSNPAYYFEAVASSTSGTTATVKLVNATSSATVATLTLASGNTYTRYRSTQFIPNASTTVEYKVVLGNEALGKGIISSRIVVLQNAGTLNNTETQIEIGSATTTASNTTTLPLQSPKYWKYDSTKWDASPTFIAEVTYKDNALASSTRYTTATTSTSNYTYITSQNAGYVVVEAWGPGGGGSIGNAGGGGGGGGSYARSTTTPSYGSSHSLAIPPGGLTDTAAFAGTVTYDTTIVSATGGSGTNANTAGVGSNAGVGDFTTAGGDGGLGDTTLDIGGGGGGGAGPYGNGSIGAAATAAVPGTGGNSGTGGGAGGSGGTTNTDTCSTSAGKAGVNNAIGGGGGGGAGSDGTGACSGGPGGYPGGGGGSSEFSSADQVGGAGQAKITEWIGTVGIAIEESDGTGDGFTGWALKKQIVVAGKTSTTSERVRSTSFTPTSGRNYRIVASTTNSTASYNIYNAKIIVDQAYNAGGVQLEDTYNESNQSGDSSMCSAGCTGGGTAQSFTSTGGTLNSAKFLLKKVGAPPANMFARLYAINNAIGGGDDIPTGLSLATSDAIAASTLTTSYVLTTFSFSGANQYAMTSGTSYVITIEYINGDVSNRVEAGMDNSSPTHTGNTAVSSGGWTAQSGNDTVFYVYGDFGAAVAVPTKLEPQYLLAPFKLLSGTSAQTFLTSWNSSEWSTTNAYIHEVDAADNSTSVVTLIDSGGTLVTNSTVSSPDNVGYSSSLCMPATGNLDVKATTNGGDIYASRILVQVGGTAASCGPAVFVPPIPRFLLLKGALNLLRGSLILPK